MRVPRSPSGPGVSTLGQQIAKLLETNPNLSTKMLASLTGKHKDTVKDRLVYELGLKKISSKWIPHTLTASEKARRVSMAEELSDVLLQEMDFDFEEIVTLDETWLLLVYPPAPRWGRPGEARQEVDRKKSDTAMLMLTPVFSGRRMWLISYMHRPLTMNSDIFLLSVLNPLDEEFQRQWGAKRGTVLLHMDNAPAHRSIKVRERLLQMNVTPLAHPPYSPDLSPCDFWLFSRLKSSLKGKIFKSETTMKADVNEFLTTIPADELYRVFLNWIKRCRHVVNTNGEYIDKDLLRTKF
jgi:histone-lysine N-methyltransferase SETMAR